MHKSSHPAAKALHEKQVRLAIVDAIQASSIAYANSHDVIHRYQMHLQVCPVMQNTLLSNHGQR